MDGYNGRVSEAPEQKDLDKCVHCGLCLNACPTYRELGLEADSPRGRIYQMVQVTTGVRKMDDTYVEHMDLCLACRACETACPSGVEYGKLIEAARAAIEQERPGPIGVRLFRKFIFEGLLPSRILMRLAGSGLWAYQNFGVQKLVRRSGILKMIGLDRVELLTPTAQMPSFFGQYGKVFPAKGARKYKVAVLGGCMANVCFARLHEATVRVLQENGCEVQVPSGQTCCGALQVHSGLKDVARGLARTNIDALLDGGFDAIITNTAGCGSTLKEYDHLLEHDSRYAERAKRFRGLMKDINEWLVEIKFKAPAARLEVTVTYQDSCHLAHGQKIRKAPREILRSIPGLELKEMAQADLCCGSAGIYNIMQNEMAMELLEKKMKYANAVATGVIATSNPGCLLQLQSGVRLHGNGQRVAHVVELLDEAYRLGWDKADGARLSA